MVKVYLCVGFSILFSIFYIFSFLFYQNENNKEAVPIVTNESVNLLSVNDPKEKVVPALPNPGSVKEIHIKSDDYDRKTKPTPLTFKQGQKTISPRLSKEEILIVGELKEAYPEIMTEALQTLPDALSKINAETGSQFVIIIDEWDMLIRDAANNKFIQERYIDFLRRLFKGMEPEKYVALAYITGILPIKKKQYPLSLKNVSDKILLVGINYDKKSKVHTCKIEELKS